MRKWLGVRGCIAIVAVLMATSAFYVGVGMAKANQEADRSYEVVFKFAQSTVAEVDTIAVVNLPEDLWMYEGEKVSVRLQNDSPIPEGFAIDALGVLEVLQPGESRVITLENAKAGAYTIYCQLHPLGVHHTGTLIVLDRPQS